jgi:glycosyltransferase involved in cell wall biosynthesis
MPKLLSVNSYHYRRGGSDVVYLEHAALMEELGWENAFFSMHHPNNMPSVWEKYFVDEIQYGHSYSFAQKIAMAGKIIYSFEAKRNIERLIEDFRPDIAHTHCIYHHLSPSILPALRKAGVPIVMTCPAATMRNDEGICEHCKSGNLFNVVKHRCIKGSLTTSLLVAVESTIHQRFELYKRNVNRVISPSRFYIEKCVEWGWPREKFVYVPNYVDAARHIPSYTLGTYFLFFGRLAPEKGVATLLRAAHAAGVSLKLVGTGPEEGALKSLHAQLGSDVEFLGYKSGTELHDIVRGARATVLPSEWYENAPLSILESYSLGKPVIGARIGGIPEMILERETGWCFESGSVEDLANVLGMVSGASDSFLEQVGRAGRRHVETCFSRSGYVEAVLNVYADVRANNGLV